MLFCVGAAFGYAMLSTGLTALVKMGVSGTGARHLWTLNAYLTFCLRFMMAFGVVFELPIVVLVLNRLGIVSAAGLRRFRRYAVVGILVVAGILTPPDVLTQLMLAGPLLVMYELSILGAAAMERHRQRYSAAEETEEETE